jgi:hypothetical protein
VVVGDLFMTDNTFDCAVYEHLFSSSTLARSAMGSGVGGGFM